MSEFIIITVLVAIIVLVAVRLFGRSVSCEFNDATNQIGDGAAPAVDDQGCVRPVSAEPTSGISGDRPPRPSPPPLPSVAPAPSPEPPPSPEPSPSASPVPSPEIVTFENPTLGGAPLDNCYNFGQNCGQFAAEIFCQSKGFKNTVAFAVSGTKIAKTYILGDGTFCDFPPPQAPFCQPFSRITCQR